MRWQLGHVRRSKGWGPVSGPVQTKRLRRAEEAVLVAANRWSSSSSEQRRTSAVDWAAASGKRLCGISAPMQLGTEPSGEKIGNHLTNLQPVDVREMSVGGEEPESFLRTASRDP